MATATASLDDLDWLRRRVEEGATIAALSAELGVTRNRVKRKLEAADLSCSRHGEEPPHPLAPASPELADIHADVARGELTKRLEDGLVELCALMVIADGSSLDHLWGVCTRLDASDARLVAYSAARLAAAQRKGGEAYQP